VAADELRRHGAGIADRDGVGEHEAACRLVGLIRQILGRGVDGDGVELLLGHDGIVNSARP
jgi:hypothetical protein